MTEIDLAHLEFFEGFSKDELARIRGMAEEVHVRAGSTLMVQGDVGRDAFVICAGQAAVYVGEGRVATLGPGSTVGEMALLDKRPRSATVKAVTDMDLLRFDSREWQKLVDSMPTAGLKIIGQLQDKLRNQNLR